MTGRRQQDSPPTGISWNEVHDRLELLRVMLDRAGDPAPAERSRILAARAKALARAPAQVTDEPRIELIEFRLAGEHYGVEIPFVREVLPLTELTRVPCTPAFVLGVVNVRGEILSLIDLKRFFDLPDAGLTDLNRVIVLQSSGMTFGVLADQVIGLTVLPLRALRMTLPTFADKRAEYLLGVTVDRLAALDARRLLSDSRLVVQETADA